VPAVTVVLVAEALGVKLVAPAAAQAAGAYTGVVTMSAVYY